MSITSEILSLRRNQSSSVETLMAKVEWLKAAAEEAHILTRDLRSEAADIVLMPELTAEQECGRGCKIDKIDLNRWIDRQKNRNDTGSLHFSSWQVSE